MEEETAGERVRLCVICNSFGEGGGEGGGGGCKYSHGGKEEEDRLYLPPLLFRPTPTSTSTQLFCQAAVLQRPSLYSLRLHSHYVLQSFSTVGSCAENRLADSFAKVQKCKRESGKLW